MSHSDFKLPGLTQTGASMGRWIVAAAWAYSSKCNNRRLEHPFYGLWNQVFQDLTADLAPQVFVVPQYQIDSIDEGPSNPDDSIATAPQPNATEFTPDFSIVKAHFSMRPGAIATVTINHLPFSSWDGIVVEDFTVPFIAELKHPPTRRCPSVKLFVQDLDSEFDRAFRNLEEQAENAFMMQPRVKKMILFAAVGEWWSWMIATRDRRIEHESDLESSDNIEASADSDGASSSSSRDDSSYILPSLFNQTSPSKPRRRQPSRPAKNDPNYTSSPIPSLKSSDMLPYHPRRKGEQKEVQLDHSKRYKDLGKDMEQVKADVELDNTLHNDWSKAILLGSSVSNQHFFFIHRFLRTECITVLDTTDSEDHDGDDDHASNERVHEDNGVPDDGDSHDSDNDAAWLYEGN